MEKPQPSPHWRMDVRNYFNAVLNSGQADWYENSDLMMLTLQCEMLDKVLRGSRTVPLYERTKNEDGKYVPVLDEDGDPIPVMDDFGEPAMRVIGNINGQALKSILDISSELMVTEGSRRRLRIDLGMPADDSEPAHKAIVAEQRAALHRVHQPKPATAPA